jgi:hypothetical protein
MCPSLLTLGFALRTRRGSGAAVALAVGHRVLAEEGTVTEAACEGTVRTTAPTDKMAARADVMTRSFRTQGS